MIESIKDFPQEFELETLVEKLIFIETKEQRLYQFGEGR